MSDLESTFHFLPESWRAPLIALLSAMGAARLVLKPGSLWIKSVILTAAEKASISLDREDDTFIEGLLRSRPYKIASFLLDLIVSVKLPAAEELFKPKPPTP